MGGADGHPCGGLARGDSLSIPAWGPPGCRSGERGLSPRCCETHPGHTGDVTRVGLGMLLLARVVPVLGGVPTEHSTRVLAAGAGVGCGVQG